MNIQIKLLVILTAIGALYGIVFHLTIIPFFHGQLLHCMVLGSLFGVMSYAAVFVTYKRNAKLEEANKLLLAKTRTETFTGLLNRQAFEDDIKEWNNSTETASIIFIDVDNFREYNNEFGHQAADTVLQKISQTIKSNIRNGDRAYRYGGEEIVIILIDCNNDNAFKIAEKTRLVVSRIEISPFPNPTISVGVASYPEDGTSIRNVIKASDDALLIAKKLGKNCVVKYSRESKN